MTPPLHGIRVVDFTRLLPGPYCTLWLADLGADVIKIEDAHAPDYLRGMPPRLADGTNVTFAWLNRGKRSVCLDLRHSAGLQAVRRLIARADVVVESFRPGRMQSLGLGAAALAAHQPQLVYCSLSGFGQDGPLRGRAGHDIGYQARGGLASMTQDDNGPIVLPIQLADIASGLHAAVAILAALLARERGASGQHLDVSMTEAAVSLLTMHACNVLQGERVITLGREEFGGSDPSYRFYRCADGRYVAVGALERKFWTALCHALGLDELIDDGSGGARACRLLEARFMQHTRDEWIEKLSRVDCCVEPVQDIDEALHSELARAREWTVEVTVGGKPVRQLACPIRFSSTAPRGPLPVTALGADTPDVLAEAGYKEDELARMKADGVFGPA